MASKQEIYHRSRSNGEICLFGRECGASQSTNAI